MISDLPVLIADVEKALVDSLDQPRYAGGLSEVAKALYQAREQLDEERLVAYANRMRNRSLCSRLGYLLERLGQPFNYAQPVLCRTDTGGEPFNKASTEPTLDGRPESLSKGSTQRFKAPSLAGLEVSQAFVWLDLQAKAKGPYDHHWRVQVNMSDEELFGWRES